MTENATLGATHPIAVTRAASPTGGMTLEIDVEITTEGTALEIGAEIMIEEKALETDVETLTDETAQGIDVILDSLVTQETDVETLTETALETGVGVMTEETVPETDVETLTGETIQGTGVILGSLVTPEIVKEVTQIPAIAKRRNIDQRIETQAETGQSHVTAATLAALTQKTAGGSCANSRTTATYLPCIRSNS